MLLISIVAFYLVVAILVFSRYAVIANRFYRPVRESGVGVKTSQWLVPALMDSAKWPWYIIWFGMKQWVEDLK
jgi:hypothetical protein